MNTKLLISLSAVSGVINIASAWAQTSRPNVVIIMTDQQRADLCGREGFPLAVTPFADSLALRNVWFDKAYTVAPASSPARCSMFTGRYPTATRVRTNHNVQDIYYTKDMLQVFKEQGYKTALVGKNHAYVKGKDFDYYEEYSHWGKNRRDTQEDKDFAKFLNDEARGQYLEPTPFPVEAQNPAKIVTKALAWAEQQKDSAFFMWVSMPEPHNPYQVSEPYFSMFSPDKLPAALTSRKDLSKKGDKYTILAELEDASCPNLQEDLPRLRANYLGMIRLIDDQTKRLVEGFIDAGLYENTIFVILSDHGDYCGEYGLIRKGAGVPECLTRIPMIWAGRDIHPQSSPMDAHVSIADIFPTVCSAIGADIPMGVQGRSLWPMLTGKSYPKKEFSSIMVQQGFGGEDFTREEPLTFAKEGAMTLGKIAHFDELNTWTQSGTLRMVRKDDWKLVMDNYGRGELYNLKTDPSEIKNLYNNKKYASRQMEMLEELVTWELRLQDPLSVPRHRYYFKRNPYNYHFQNNSK